MSNDGKKVGRREKYPFAKWEVGDTFSVICVYDLVPTMRQRLMCSAINRKKDKLWRFETYVKPSIDVDYSIVTIKRVK